MNPSLFPAFGAALALGACAAAPPLPTDALQAAEIAITTADGDKAAEFAPVELQAARERLRVARKTIANDPDPDDVMTARRLAIEAQSDAELASARARKARADAVNADLQKNIDTLRQELQRSGAAS
jgi:hypothetical protein